MRPRPLMTLTIGVLCIASLVGGCGAPAIPPEVKPTHTSTPLPVTATLFPATVTSFAVEPFPSSGKPLLIYDDDGSRDGTAALLYLLDDPGISIKAITISYGEAHPEIYIQHIARMLDGFGIQYIPLGAGQDAPLAGATPFPDWLRQMSDTFWGFPLPNAGKTYTTQPAPELMVSTIKQASEPVTIFMTGTFTSLAQALRLDPGIKEKITAVYFMGGAVYVPGNITNLIPDSSNKVAEWNIYADPQAAREVFDSGLDMYMVPLDATGKVLLRQEDISPWHRGGPKATLVADLYDPMFTDYGFKTVEIFDLTAAVIMATPDLCIFKPLRLDVVTGDGNTVGQTAVVQSGKPNIQVCLEPSVDRIKQALNDRFSGTGQTLEIPSIEPVVGTWTGSVFNNGFEMQISLTIEDTCQPRQKCGQFDISTVSCSGTLTWVGMDGDMYQFEAGDKTPACGEGKDYLLPQKDGTVIYISRGDYGETNGALQRAP